MKKLRYLSRRALVFLAVVQVVFLALSLLLWYVTLRENAIRWPAYASTALYLVQFAGLYFWLYRPFRETERVLELFARGFTMEGVLELSYPPTPATQETVLRVQELLSTGQLASASKRQAQYLALQNQINPHFLYNTLEGIRSDALVAGLDNVAKMTEALSTFFRYTISNLEHLVTLEEELANIENYFTIQQYRFGERLSLRVVFDDETDREQLMKAKLPKLTLQPIVENAIVHGVEGKVGDGRLTIRVQATEKRLLVTVADDGLGMSQEQLKALHEKLNTVYYDYVHRESERRGGIALVNVNNRIRLLFGEDYGLEVYSTPGMGTDVVVTLPYQQGKPQGAPL